MAINKDALVRYRTINQCLLNKAHLFPTKEYLKEKCSEALGKTEISNRTFDKDIQEMRHNEELGYKAPIEYSPLERGYYYSDPNYSIDKIPLRQEDLKTLQYAASLLKQFSHISLLKDFSATVTKIMEAVNINRILGEDSQLDFIEFEKADYLIGGSHLETLVIAIKNNCNVSFTYRKHGHSGSKSYHLQPFLIKAFRNRWYVIGKELDSLKIKTFGLDRIQEIQEEKESETAPNFDKTSYFKHAFGITSYNKEPSDVVLSFSRKTGDFIKTLPLHQSQEVLAETDKECIIKITVYPTQDLLMQLLSYGDEVTILEPQDFKNQLVKILKNTLKNYK